MRCARRFATRPLLKVGLSMEDVTRSDGTYTAPAASEPQLSPWLTVIEAARRARCGPRLIYREVRANRLRAARVGGRRELRIRAEWIDTWLEAYTTPQEIVRWPPLREVADPTPHPTAAAERFRKLVRGR
jgi:excisionase family DNA binding protein